MLELDFLKKFCFPSLQIKRLKTEILDVFLFFSLLFAWNQAEPRLLSFIPISCTKSVSGITCRHKL